MQYITAVNCKQLNNNSEVALHILLINLFFFFFFFLFSETAKAYKELGDAALAKEEYQNALGFYTQGINVKCKDDQLNVELYRCRWLSNCHLGKFSLSYV